MPRKYNRQAGPQWIKAASKIGQKAAIKSGPNGTPKEGRAYDIYRIVPRGDVFHVLVVDTETQLAWEVGEEFFDWAKPWYETIQAGPASQPSQAPARIEV